MRLRMWTYDLAREQSPSLDNLRTLAQLSLESGYTSLGLYLEHRFAYPSAPWAHGTGAVTPEMIKTLESEFPELQIVPFINLLGHFEGFLYTEPGRKFAEERFKGLQADPTNEEFLKLCRSLLDDTLQAFRSDLIHIGGDETAQLGVGRRSQAQVNEYESRGEHVDGRAHLYGHHFGPLARYVVEKGRTPAVWGDMFSEHPQALEFLPQETIVFDWQYFSSPRKTATRFTEAGHRVVLCPAVHVYNATWCHLAPTERNVRDHVASVPVLNAEGVCVTTWESGLFGNYETLLPLIRACGELLQEDAPLIGLDTPEVDYHDQKASPAFLRAYLTESERHEEWARLMGIELPAIGGVFGYSGTRSALKCRLLLYSNPFLLWLHHREELTGAIGDAALKTLEYAAGVAPDVPTRSVAEFARAAIEFVRHTEAAAVAYADHQPGAAAAALAPTRQIFDNLARSAQASVLRFGGSRADVERCRAAREHVERVMMRIKQYGDGSLGYLPSFEHLSHPKFIPHDQGAWWLINRWANE